MASLRDKIATIILEGVKLDDCGYSGDAAYGKADAILGLPEIKEALESICCQIVPLRGRISDAPAKDA